MAIREVLQHRRSGERFIVEVLEDGTYTWYCGPILRHQLEDNPDLWEWNLDYPAQPSDFPLEDYERIT